MSQTCEEICDAIAATLQEDREEGLIDGLTGATKAAEVTCKHIAHQVGPEMLSASGLTWAAFGLDDKTVLFVVRGLDSYRRVDFHISTDGLNISITRLDFDCKAVTVYLSADDAEGLREHAAWVLDGSIAPPEPIESG